ncbi:MAG TPA: hypothetical protein VFP49_01760 [Nitrososphaeraceae archaeon]|nr:hypothetical protein [Nitrososphaeraceae archaeon]
MDTDYIFKNMLDEKNLLCYIAILSIAIIILSFFCLSEFKIVYSDNQTESEKIIGVNMKGMYTSLNYERFPNITIPSDYYAESFKLIKNIGMNHIRYVLYWEAYENNPSLFLQELENVATLADKLGLKIIYDNHQFHTSSWLDEKRGTGFPSFLFDKSLYSVNSGITTSSNSTELWWTNWWNRNVTDENNKINGWNLQANFLKTIVKLLDNHNSTNGYEILNEPQIFSQDQWSKIGKYYKFMTNELRKQTNKTIVLDMTIPIKFQDPAINLTSENMAKIIPKDRNSVFKISLYGIPRDNNYQDKKLELLINVSKIAKIPVYVGEWNNVNREKKLTANRDDTSKINVIKSDLSQEESDFLINKFNQLEVYGWAFWNWNYVNTPPQNFNLINITKSGDILPTKYFYILKNSVNK